MNCPACGRWGPDDPDSGYSADDLCPDCAREGWVETANGDVLNELAERAGDDEPTVLRKPGAA